MALTPEATALAIVIRCDWILHCVLAVENMLLIQYYPAPAKKISHWRSRAWRRRCDLGYVHNDNPGLGKRHLDELVDESWLIARDDAIGSMAKLDCTGLDSFQWKEKCQRWDRYLPRNLPYSLEEILGRDPEQGWAVPKPDSWPAGVKRKLLEVFGPDLDFPDLPKKWRVRNPAAIH